MRTEDRVQRNQAYDPVDICKGRRSTLYVHKALFVYRNCKTVSSITAALCVNVLFNKQQSAHVEEIVIIKKKYRITSVLVTKSLILILNLQPDFGDKYVCGYIENLGITKQKANG